MRIIDICAKCPDAFCANLVIDDQCKGGYKGDVPNFFPGQHYGEYILLKIDVDTGNIVNWKKPTGEDLTKTFSIDN
jgi:hypothetical protein